MKQRKFNFSAGPSMLPLEVLQQIKEELFNWHDVGASIMEVSHRSKEFVQVACSAEHDLRTILNIPNNYKVLFCQGGARAQFAAVPMNILGSNINADYANSGYWSYSAANEAKKYCKPRIFDVSIQIDGLRKIQPICNWPLSDNSAYIHYCPNETIDGLAIDEIPEFNNAVVVGDFSSTLLSRPLNVNKFGLIYAAAQKNIGPSGLTIVIVREDLLGHARIDLPSILNYQLLSINKSMLNTPPTFSWYVAGLVFKWLKEQGGLTVMNELNKIKSDLLYTTIDKNDFYHNDIFPINRSLTNITFRLVDNQLEKLFLEKSLNEGLYALQGHKLVGGMRASLYNAMTLQGVKKLVEFMNWFAVKYG
ncbi:3-phosphoserine/phosphohydroxythreonine transaminase [Blochmannia endosymbiont of Camponotus (Colobopsis) obliquus]|uniref:3-phosphoserine/phosphohydroxythreonine transaminase n=1 Tax=Blochmannia endosymbiont of Camponotus (Colobopsis) obliquus TaxID=1505597 RepID=UPI00061A7018|nr:3-phosphoserine/phosphohydroxythreonine transaminase [Blochmannia endosymbiont of Camponotus (Colobopsis) obliquus]AKC60542.1 Phosphoserine aminotransferase [Blochmannia endosymbiont of Camponotus (Colobopsis) obliquus]